MTKRFLLHHILLGAGLSMDAFSISIANGVYNPNMPVYYIFFIAGVYGIFQAVMPIIGWLCVRMASQQFTYFHDFIPWIGAALLGFIGFQMIFESESPQNNLNNLNYIHQNADEYFHFIAFNPIILLLQGAATSMDALSVGFAIAEYDQLKTFSAAGIIAAVTFCLCMGGLKIGQWFGIRLARRASVLGGIILIIIALEILLRACL